MFLIDITHYILPITYYPLPITYYPLPITYYITAIAAYTRGGAAADGATADRGTLSPGRRADAVVLDGDPFTVPRAEITRIRVRTTLIDGRLTGEHA